MSPVQRDVERILGMHKLTTTELSVLRKHAVNRGETISVELIDAVIDRRLSELDTTETELIKQIETHRSKVTEILNAFPDKPFNFIDVEYETVRSLEYLKHVGFIKSVHPDYRQEGQ